MSHSNGSKTWRDRPPAPDPSASERASKLLQAARDASRNSSSKPVPTKPSRNADPFDQPLPELKHGAIHEPSGSSSFVQEERAPSPPPAQPVTLHDLLKLLTTPVSKSRAAPDPFTLPSASDTSNVSALTMREAMPIAGKLFSKGYNNSDKLSILSVTLLQDIGIEGEEMRNKIVRAIRGSAAVPEKKSTKRLLGGSAAGPASSTSPTKRARRGLSPTSLGREWGNIEPEDSKGKGRAIDGDGISYEFNEIMDEETLKGKYVLVNRAPVMTAWATVVLEKMGFERQEALSLSHCYVNSTATARGVSIGVLQPATIKEKELARVGPNQPHFELMNVRIPVLQLENGAYRGISNGEMVPPDKAWNYMRNAMFQTLPMVMGALYLLADSYMEPETSAKKEEEVEANVLINADDGSSSTAADTLHRSAYLLYSEFRPETGGQWGKKATLYIDQILKLRKGHQLDDIKLDHALGEDWNPDDLGVEKELGTEPAGEAREESHVAVKAEELEDAG